MEHQYPVAITGDEHMLAELMLPDQAHVRNQDWTIFFLHKDTTQEEDEDEPNDDSRPRRRRRRNRDEDASDNDPGEEEGDEDDLGSDEDGSNVSEPEGGEGPPLIYVLNLVNTKQDKTAKRGAVVKAMAICTRHPFLHIYKVILLAPEISHHSDNIIAPFVVSTRRILQKSASRDPGVTLYRC